jgi:CDP-paratose 2-epimerase
LNALERRIWRPLAPIFAETRPGDQPVFVADIRKAKRDLGWAPKTSKERGIGLLYEWIVSHRSLFGP